MKHRLATCLDVQLVNVGEKVLDAIVVLDVVQQHEPHLPSSHKRRHIPLVELVDCLEIPASKTTCYSLGKIGEQEEQ